MAKKSPKIFKLDTSTKKNEKDELKDFMNLLDEINDMIDYLPPDSFLLIPFLDPLIKEAGLNKRRFDKIIMTNSPTEEEKELLQWASEIGFLMLDVVMENNKKEKELLREEAIDVAADYVPRIKSRKILPELEAVFEELKEMGKLDSGPDKLIN